MTDCKKCYWKLPSIRKIIKRWLQVWCPGGRIIPFCVQTVQTTCMLQKSPQHLYCPNCRIEEKYMPESKKFDPRNRRTNIFALSFSIFFYLHLIYKLIFNLVSCLNDLNIFYLSVRAADLFCVAPAVSEPIHITFSLDYKYSFPSRIASYRNLL